MDILTRNLIWIFYSSGYESELKEILYDEDAVTSPGDVEVSVEDIEDEEKLEQLGKAILCSRRLFFAYYLNMHYACNHCIGTGSDDKNGIL